MSAAVKQQSVASFFEELMMPPPIIAYHVIFGAYGFWLPNDPRGSWSKFVWAKYLIPFGDPVPANSRRSLAKKPHDRQLRLAAKAALTNPAVRFNGPQIQCIGDPIGDDVRKYQFPIFALAVMPDHVHMVFGRTEWLAEEMVGFFKRTASRALRKNGLHPFIDRPLNNDRLPTPWCEGGWKVYLHEGEVEGRIRYVENNPLEIGLPRQQWEFLVPYR